jgi:hypothetical protein
MNETNISINSRGFRVTHTAPTWRSRGFIRITAEDGTAVSFYDDGNLRVQKPGHLVEIGDANPESTYINFVPRTDGESPRSHAACYAAARHLPTRDGRAWCRTEGGPA